jgi:hypothetical protein
MFVIGGRFTAMCRNTARAARVLHKTWSSVMIGSDILRPEPLPSLWKVLLFRIRQAEERERILSDWENNVFGIRLERREKRLLH